ncbi:hypothetical protein [Stenotrophomonas lactitubi]|uniref:hypothetical protein n=1 Tax=Stenotrophomonas lactitubi TaxID=2045214 RepID=UPI00203F02F1|nr:hypothetical protein [Stenotrophomonas lactitubi]
MSSPSCAALLAIVACMLLQAFGLSLHWRAESGHACLQQHKQDLVCLVWTQAVETSTRAG